MHNILHFQFIYLFVLSSQEMILLCHLVVNLYILLQALSCQFRKLVCILEACRELYRPLPIVVVPTLLEGKLHQCFIWCFLWFLMTKNVLARTGCSHNTYVVRSEVEVSHVWHGHLIKDDTSGWWVGELRTKFLLCYSIFIVVWTGTSVDGVK